MSYPFETYDHVHVSEREAPHRWPDGQQDSDGWEDCLFTSGLELYRFAGGDAPATLQEAEQVRAAAGVQPMGPSNIGKLATGMQKRYGRTFRLNRGRGELRTLAPGEAALVAGSLGHFPAGHSLRRWDPTYNAGHGLVVFRFPGRWWWCDPLAPRTYTGQWVTETAVETFMYAGSTFAFAVYNEFREADMIPMLDARAREIDLAAGVVLYDSAHTPVRTLEGPSSVVSPFIVDATYRAAFATVAGVAQLVLVKRGDAQNVRLPDEVNELVRFARAGALEAAVNAVSKLK